MKAERASTTALMVAYMRALADAGASHVRDFHDPTARVFLNGRWLRRLTKREQELRSGRESYALAFSRVTADPMALRTATIDAAVRTAMARGIQQVVILGAGLDGRAWRMPELAGVRVYEVDHPATQALKRSRLAALPSPIAGVTFVALDFERARLEAALAQAGHDRTRPTCWIWEGVVMYLTRDAMVSTLTDVASRSAEGSSLVVNYHTAVRRGFTGLFLRVLGEPMKSKWSPQEIAATLRAAGFEVIEDSGIEDWARRFAAGPVVLRAGGVMRIVVALRRREIA